MELGCMIKGCFFLLFWFIYWCELGRMLFIASLMIFGTGTFQILNRLANISLLRLVINKYNSTLRCVCRFPSILSSKMFIDGEIMRKVCAIIQSGWCLWISFMLHVMRKVLGFQHFIEQIGFVIISWTCIWRDPVWILVSVWVVLSEMFQTLIYWAFIVLNSASFLDHGGLSSKCFSNLLNVISVFAHSIAAGLEWLLMIVLVIICVIKVLLLLKLYGFPSHFCIFLCSVQNCKPFNFVALKIIY